MPHCPGCAGTLLRKEGRYMQRPHIEPARQRYTIQGGCRHVRVELAARHPCRISTASRPQIWTPHDRGHANAVERRRQVTSPEPPRRDSEIEGVAHGECAPIEPAGQFCSSIHPSMMPMSPRPCRSYPQLATPPRVECAVLVGGISPHRQKVPTQRGRADGRASSGGADVRRVNRVGG